MKKFEEFINEAHGNNKKACKSKEILNNLRNVMMMKPDMPFVAIIYNALDTADVSSLDDEDVLSKLQKYVTFLKENK
jgi:hypothetical protein